MGLRRLPRAKPTSQVDDLYHILITHWVWHFVVFADEKQRLFVPTGILLASVSGCRLVSLFDTRVKIDVDRTKDNCDGQDRVNVDGSIDTNTILMNNMILKDHIDSISSSTKYSNYAKPDTYLDIDIDNDRYSQTDNGISSGTEEDLNCYSDEDLFSETEAEADSATTWDADDSSVTDDEYDTGAEETRTILWRHVVFYIIRSPVKGRPNIPVAKLTLLHTKGEDRKPRVSVGCPVISCWYTDPSIPVKPLSSSMNLIRCSIFWAIFWPWLSMIISLRRTFGTSRTSTGPPFRHTREACS